MLDIVIATYNRFEKAKLLGKQLQNIGGHLVCNIIIVDSTEGQTNQSEIQNQFFHILTSHKNQPFQRFLGYQKSTSDFILFLDDDMEIANKNCLQKISEICKDDISGIAIHFKDKHQDTSLNAIEKSAFGNRKNSVRSFFNWFSGYPNLPDGVFGLCGVRGKQSHEVTNTQFVSGGAFVANRKCLYQNFNFQLFDLYDQKLGKGEDAIMGYSLSKQKKLVFFPELLFYHNDQKDSAYSIDQYSFFRRVTFSRLFLTLEKLRLDSKSKIQGYFYFHWHTFWRILGLMLNCLLKPSEARFTMLKGALRGWILAVVFQFKFKDSFKKE